MGKIQLEEFLITTEKKSLLDNDATPDSPYHTFFFSKMDETIAALGYYSKIGIPN